MLVEREATARWNLRALMLDVTCFALAMSFLDQNAVYPLLLQRLGASGPLIGAAAALRFLGFTGLQIIVAFYTHGRARQKPFLAFVATVTRLPLLLLPVILWRAADSVQASRLALVATVVVITIWALGDGLGYVPWMEIVARTFTARARGRFFAMSQLTSGVITVGIGLFAVTAVLNSRALPYPHNYALLAAIAAIMFQVSLVGVLLIREPAAPRDLPRMPHTFMQYFRRLPGMIRGNAAFGRLAAVQLLIGFGAAAAPFYVLYASGRFHLADSWGGTFQALQAVGVVALTPLWTFISERYGAVVAVRALAIACVLTPLTALTIGLSSAWLFGLVFVFMGGSLGWGMWIVLNHYMLYHIGEEDRPIFVALINLLYVPSAIYPYFGGMLIRHERFILIGDRPALFMLTGLVVAAGAVLTLRLPAPDAATPVQAPVAPST